MSDEHITSTNQISFKNNTKVFLSYKGLMNQSEIFDIVNEDKNEQNIITNPFYKLIENYESIKLIIGSKIENIMEYLYLNRKQIHQILYNEDAIIYINNDIITKFEDYYYLYSLIRCEEDLINYTYDITLINNLDKILKKTGAGIKKIILAKILLQLINNYIYFDDAEENYVELTNQCINLINTEKNNLERYNIYKDLNQLNFSELKIDEIYCEIILSLLKNNKLDDSNDTIDLLNELNIINLRLNKTIFNGLLKVLKKDNLKSYLISSYDDLFIKDKLIFYYILFKYILKSSDYIFHIPFLFETREEIIKIINEHFYEFLFYFNEGDNKENKNIVKEVLKYFIELEFYINECQNKKKSKSNLDDNLKSDNARKYSILEYIPIRRNSFGTDEINSSFNNSTLSDISFNRNSFGEYEKNKKEDVEDMAYNFMSESTFTININYKKGEKEAFLKYKKIICKEKEFKIEDVKNIESEDVIIDSNFKQFLQFLDDVEKELKSKYKREKEIDIDLKFIMTNEDSYGINCIYEVKSKDFYEKYLEDEDILNNNYYYDLFFMISVFNDHYNDFKF